MATLGLSETEKAAVEAFRRDVVDPSRTSLVIVDFWAEWCGPCKQLAPVIEKVCAEYAAKGVKLVKVNVDENGFIASQFRVQSIPTVYAVFQGQPVADLSQARTEGQLKQYLDQLLAQLPIESDEKALKQEVAPLIAMGEEMLAGGEHERALSIFTQIADMDPDNVEVIGGQARALAGVGRSARPSRACAPFVCVSVVDDLVGVASGIRQTWQLRDVASQDRDSEHWPLQLLQAQPRSPSSITRTKVSDWGAKEEASKTAADASPGPAPTELHADRASCPAVGDDLR